MNSSGNKILAGLLALLMSLGLIVPMALSASAFQTSGLMFYFDFSNLDSTNNGDKLIDFSGQGRDGTIRGNGISYNSETKALQFAGGPNGTNYVELGGEFTDFSKGVSIEFEGEFGAIRSQWERIFDFGSTYVVGSNNNNQFWVGHMENSNELAVEIWIDNVNQGRCHTVDDALGTAGDRTFHKWLITIGEVEVGGGTKCRIYKNGVEVPVQLRDAGWGEGPIVESGGLAYPLPKVTTRPTNYLGRSNYSPDSDFEGSIRYIRLYDTVLTAEQAQENAKNTYTVTYEEHGGSEVADGTFTEDGSLTFPDPPTRAGYTFAGWFAAETGGTAKTATEIAEANKSVTLHAQWTAKTFNVTYDEHGGSAVADGSYTFGNTISFPSNPTRSGYKFLGWFDAESGGSALSAETVSARTADSTLHAQWEALSAQNVTWTPSKTSYLNTDSAVTPEPGASTDGGGTISYSISDAGSTGCSVNSATGALTFTGVGVCVVRATAAANANYAAGSEDVEFEIGSTSPAMSLVLNLETGDEVADQQVAYGAAGLQSDSEWSLVVRSTPQTIASGTFAGSLVSGSAQIPENLTAGWHSITLTGYAPDGSLISHAVWFEVSESGTLLGVSDEAPIESDDEGGNGSDALPGTGMAEKIQTLLMLSLLLLLGGALAVRKRIS